MADLSSMHSYQFQQRVMAPLVAEAQTNIRKFLFESMELKEVPMTEADWETVCEIEAVLWSTYEELARLSLPGLQPPANP